MYERTGNFTVLQHGPEVPSARQQGLAENFKGRGSGRMGINWLPLSPLLVAPMEHLQPQDVLSSLALMSCLSVTPWGNVGISER